jgi:hypothetical protein
MRQIFRKYWVALALFLLALVPRMVLSAHLSVISDVSRDYHEASAMLNNREIVWMGIPSSVPRFAQGPFNIWFDVLAFMLFGTHAYAPVFLSGLLVAVSIALFYRFLSHYVGMRAALAAAVIWAGSIGAIRQSRMPFYLFAEPVFLLLFLFVLTRVKQTNRWAMAASLSFLLLFQWELATIPLFALIPIVIFKHRLRLKHIYKGLFAGAIIGLAPQIIFDLSHQCRQLCGFAVWMVYRTTAVTGFDGRHGYTFSKFTELFKAIFSQLYDLVGLGSVVVFALVLSVGFLSIFIKHKSELHKLSIYGIALLFFGLFIHGTPSEAYFPPFVILLPIIFAFGMNRLRPVWQIVLLVLIILAAVISSYSLISNQFYLPARSVNF